MTRQHIALWPRKAPIHCEVWGLPYERRCSSESMAEEAGALWRVRFLQTTTTLMRSSKDATNITARKPTATRQQEEIQLPSAWRTARGHHTEIVKPEWRLIIHKKANASAADKLRMFRRDTDDWRVQIVLQIWYYIMVMVTLLSRVVNSVSYFSFFPLSLCNNCGVFFKIYNYVQKLDPESGC